MQANGMHKGVKASRFLNKKTKLKLPGQYKASTSNPTYEVEVVHPMNRISEHNELQIALDR